MTSETSNLLLHFLQNLDIELLTRIYQNRVQWLDSGFVVFTDSAGLIAFGVPVVLLLTSFFTKNAAARRDALRILLPVAISAIVANILKYATDLPRPYEIYPYIVKLSVGGSPSFPSGHTVDAFAFAVAVGLVYRKWYFTFPSLIWAVLIGYSRICLGVHFPSDVLAGAIIGAFFASAYQLVDKKTHARTG